MRRHGAVRRVLRGPRVRAPLGRARGRVHDVPRRGGLREPAARSGPAPVPRIWGRAIFWVDDVDAVHDRAVGAGLAPEMAPADAPWGERYFHLRDPDGHELSFARVLGR
ncbi:MAG: VOC family protein [Acidimicrobiales bacterium]